MHEATGMLVKLVSKGHGLEGVDIHGERMSKKQVETSRQEVEMYGQTIMEASVRANLHGEET